MPDAQKVIDFLKANGYTLAIAESFTGGLVADAFIRIPGASDVVLGSIVAYADNAKQKILGVPAPILESHGAVSRQTASAMAEGARRVFGSACAVATTGIAGPNGATATKPVGLCYAAAVGPPGEHVSQETFRGDRDAVRQAGVEQAVGALVTALGLRAASGPPSP